MKPLLFLLLMTSLSSCGVKSELEKEEQKKEQEMKEAIEASQAVKLTESQIEILEGNVWCRSHRISEHVQILLPGCNVQQLFTVAINKLSDQRYRRAYSDAMYAINGEKVIEEGAYKGKTCKAVLLEDGSGVYEEYRYNELEIIDRSMAFNVAEEDAGTVNNYNSGFKDLSLEQVIFIEEGGPNKYVECSDLEIEQIEKH